MQSIMYDENSLVLATWYFKLSWLRTKLAKVWHNLSNFYFMPKTKILSSKFCYNWVTNLQIYPCNKHQSRSKILILIFICIFSSAKRMGEAHICFAKKSEMHAIHMLHLPGPHQRSTLNMLEGPLHPLGPQLHWKTLTACKKALHLFFWIFRFYKKINFPNFLVYTLRRLKLQNAILLVKHSLLVCFTEIILVYTS